MPQQRLPDHASDGRRVARHGWTLAEIAAYLSTSGGCQSLIADIDDYLATLSEDQRMTLNYLAA